MKNKFYWIAPLLVIISLSNCTVLAAAATLEQRIDKIVKKFPGTVGIYAKNLKTGKTIAINADKMFPMASTYKVPIMLQVYKDAEAGKLNLKTKLPLISGHDYVYGSGILKHLSKDLKLSVHDLTYMMITLSDNIATDILLDKVKAERVTKTVKSLGLNSMDVSRSTVKMIDDIHNSSAKTFLADTHDAATPKDMSKLLELIATGKIVNQESTRQMMKIMRSQKVSSRLPRYMANVSVAHKTGTTDLVTNDAGIIKKSRDENIVITVFTIKKSPNTPTYIAEEVIGKIAKEIVKG